MCLAVPAQLVQLNGSDGIADLHGNRVPVNTMLVPEAAIGDWILMHAGFAIQRLAFEAVQRTWAVLEDLDAAIVQSSSSECSSHDDQGGASCPNE